MSDIVRAFPLTPLQEGMLYHAIRNPRSSLYHGQLAARLDGPLNLEAFRDAWSRAAGRHEAFRTLFTWEGRERPLQVVLKNAELPIRVIDWSGREEEAEGLWAELLERDKDEIFDLARAPLMRVTVADLGAKGWGVVWMAHHAVLDGWSARSVWQEVIEDLRAGTEARIPPRDPAPSYADYVGWLSEQGGPELQSWWRAYLEGVERPTPAPAVADGVSSTQRRYARRTLPSTHTRMVREAAARMRVTLATLTTAAWSRVLAGRSHGEDVVFGVTTSERPAEIEGIGSAAGLYLATVPIRVGAPADPVGPWLQRLQQSMGEARARGAPGLSNIRRWSGIEGPDLIRSLVVFESFPAVLESPQDPRLKVESIQVTSPSDLPMALLVHPGDDLLLELEYDPARTSGDSTTAILDEMVTALAELTQQSELLALRVSRSTLGPPSESWTRGAGAPSVHPDVFERFEAHAAATPGAVAVVGEGDTATYAQLGSIARSVSEALLDWESKPRLIAIPALRTPETLAAMLGCLGAGHPYVPIDPTLPPARQLTLLARADGIVAPPEVARSLPEHGLPTIWPSEGSSRAGYHSSGITRSGLSGAAYVIFTSGSTGTPKGVVVGRDNLNWSTAARFAYYDDAPSSFLVLSPLSVDSSVAGLYWTLNNGGAVHLPPHRGEQDLRAIATTIAEQRVTHILLVPSLYRELLDEPAFAAGATSLRVVIVAGEACSPDVVRSHFRRLPSVRLFNEYGPSETTVWATVDELGTDREVTIGRPVPGARAWVVDGDLTEVASGETGELLLGGPGVARGYLDDAEATALRFIDDESTDRGRAYRSGDRARWRPDGRLEFLGRIDEQLKVRGHRVEALEIETVLESHPGVKEALVALTPQKPRTLDGEAEGLVEVLRNLPVDEADRLIRMIEEKP